MAPRPDYSPLDRIDRAILQLLQRDARNAKAVDIAEHVDVSDGTVRNRIAKLEEEGVIEGYVPVINYEQAGYQLQIRFECSASIVERKRLAEEALAVDGVVEVTEIMTGRGNVGVTAVAPSNDDVTRIALTLDELGLTVESEQLVRHHYFQPFDHFGTEDVSDDDGIHEA